MASSQSVIPAGEARAVVLHGGERLRVIDVEGQQVCDFFAFVLNDPVEHFSVCETRGELMKLNPHVEAPMYSNRGRELMFWERDTVGVHDSRAAACDLLRYWSYGVDRHRSCKQNLIEALAGLGVSVPVLPDPLNLFQNTPFGDSVGYDVRPSLSKPGDYVEFRAMVDLIVVGSACPMDQSPLNGPKPTDILFTCTRVNDPSGGLNARTDCP